MSENETIAVEFKSSREFPMSLPPFIPRNRPRKRKKKYKEFKNSRTRFKEEEEKKYSRNSKANLSQPFERWYRSRGITNTTKVSNDLENCTRKREREKGKRRIKFSKFLNKVEFSRLFAQPLLLSSFRTFTADTWKSARPRKAKRWV